MPRQARIDGTGAIHHIIVRGIEKRKIFDDDEDMEFFLRRLSLILEETKTACYAWALIPNHFHLLLRTGASPVSTVMRRLLTGYAQYYNKRHNRHGHLFQNRYKSILCEEEAYLFELVRYIHLNPLRANIVKTMDELDQHPYGGQSIIVNGKLSFMDADYILMQFDKSKRKARKMYREFVEAGVSKKRRDDLTGGGLIRSSGGWEALTAKRAKGFKAKGDERILGSSDFVERILSESEDTLNNSLRLKLEGYDINRLAVKVEEISGINPLKARGKYRAAVRARRIFCYWAVRELGFQGTEIGRLLGISQPGVSLSVMDGEKIVIEEKLRLNEDGN
jgi:REP element-mobilizing transposase RayT